MARTQNHGTPDDLTTLTHAPGVAGATGPYPVTGADLRAGDLRVVVIAGAATLVPALRAARTSTIQALTNPSHPPRRRSRLIALSAHLPVPLLLGLRLAARRPRRTVLSAASLAITVAMIVVAITIQRNLSASNLQLGATEYLPHNAIAGRINQITLVLAAGLVILAAINAISSPGRPSSTVDDRRHWPARSAPPHDKSVPDCPPLNWFPRWPRASWVSPPDSDSSPPSSRP